MIYKIKWNFKNWPVLEVSEDTPDLKLKILSADLRQASTGEYKAQESFSVPKSPNRS